MVRRRATLAATWGFLQTETQAEAGTEKVCYEIECPDWSEVRLDAIGFCVTAPVLTNSAFPELINRVLQIGATAHAHKVNASIINRISTLIGTAINWTEVGGATSDILDAAELQAKRLRYTYSMAPGATIELMRGDHVHARGVADASGLFAIVPPTLPPGSHQVALQSIAPDGVRQRSPQTVTVVIDAAQKRPLVTLTTPNQPTVVLSNPEPPEPQVAQKEPEPPAKPEEPAPPAEGKEA